MKICPECKKEVKSEIRICPHCGYDIEENLVKCSECGNMVARNADSCPACGCSMNHSDTADGKKVLGVNGNKQQYIGYGLIAIALILMIVSFTRVNNKKYNFYKEHYAECEEGYEEAKNMADSYGYGLFKSTYNMIADSYQELMDADKKEMNSYRIQAVVYLGAAVILLFFGVKNVRRN